MMYKKPDLHAPRNRNKVKDFLAYPAKDTHGFFARLKDQHPDLRKYTNREIAVLIEECNKLMAHEVATSWDGVILPEGLGCVVVGAVRISQDAARHNIDYNASKKTGQIVTHRNDHTDGYVAVIKYTNDIPRQKFINHKQWTFKPCRKLKREVAAEFKKGNFNRYRHFSKWYRASDVFRKRKTHKPTLSEVKAENERIKQLQAYDEFSFD